MIPLDKIRSTVAMFKAGPVTSVRAFDFKGTVLSVLLDNYPDDFECLLDYLARELCLEFSPSDHSGLSETMTVNKLVDRCWVLANEGA